MTITATLPPPPITAEDIARAEARTSYNPITREIFEFPAQSSLPRLDGLTAMQAAELIERDWPIPASAIYGPPQLPALCNRPKQRMFDLCSPGSREPATAWYIVPEGNGVCGWAACDDHLPELPAKHWYKYQRGAGNLHAQEAMRTYTIIGMERRRIRRWENVNGGGEFAAYHQARLDIAMPAMMGMLARRAGLDFDAYAPKPLPELPPPVPVAAAEQAGVDILPDNRTAQLSIAARIRAAFTR